MEKGRGNRNFTLCSDQSAVAIAVGGCLSKGAAYRKNASKIKGSGLKSHSYCDKNPPFKASMETVCSLYCGKIFRDYVSIESELSGF
ncbi:hypothetical protein SLE2022_053690 [Rubroshorea leprosula]